MLLTGFGCLIVSRTWELPTSPILYLSFPIDQGGNYPVTLVVTDENGCSSQITRTIEILDLFSLYIPTAFSPNNDGTNDAFFAVGTDIDPARFSMQVINRWGNLVFETTDVNEVWYGKSNDASEHFAQGRCVLLPCRRIQLEQSC